MKGLHYLLALYLPNYPIKIFTHLNSSEWKLIRFDKIEDNSFQITLVDVTFIYNIFKMWYLCISKKCNPEYMRHRWLKG